MLVEIPRAMNDHEAFVNLDYFDCVLNDGTRLRLSESIYGEFLEILRIGKASERGAMVPLTIRAATSNKIQVK